MIHQSKGVDQFISKNTATNKREVILDGRKGGGGGGGVGECMLHCMAITYNSPPKGTRPAF